MGAGPRPQRGLSPCTPALSVPSPASPLWLSLLPVPGPPFLRWSWSLPAPVPWLLVGQPGCTPRWGPATACSGPCFSWCPAFTAQPVWGHRAAITTLAPTVHQPFLAHPCPQNTRGDRPSLPAGPWTAWRCQARVPGYSRWPAQGQASTAARPHAGDPALTGDDVQVSGLAVQLAARGALHRRHRELVPPPGLQVPHYV